MNICFTADAVNIDKIKNKSHFTGVTSCILTCSVQVFDQYVKTRAEEERKEKKNKIMQAKEEFRRMMEEARLGVR